MAKCGGKKVERKKSEKEKAVVEEDKRLIIRTRVINKLNK